MVKQNEKTIMKSADVCPGQVWHKVFYQRVWLPQHLQIILILVLCAGVVLSTNTTEEPSASLPKAQSGVIYFIEVTVDANGTNITEQDIRNWLQPVFQNNLQTCRSPVHTTSAPNISTGPFITNNVTNVSSTFEINVTDPGTTSHTTIEATAITVIINNPAANTSNLNANQSTTFITDNSTANSIANSTANSTANSNANSTANSTATSLVTSTIPITTSTISSSVNTLGTNTAGGTSPTFTPTTNTNLQSSAPQSTREKPSNTPNSNSERLIRVAREISVEGADIFKDFEASCVNTTSISETNCYITLTLKEKVNPCCILQTLCEASKVSTNITVTGKKVERVGTLQPNDTQCSDPYEDVCVYQGPSGPTCAETGTEFSISSSNSTQCEHTCNCTAYCSGTDTYYTFKITTEDFLLAESAITSLLSAMTSVPECTSNLSCAAFDLAPKYKSSSFTCTKNLYCTVVVMFSEEIPICALSDLIASLLSTLNINMIGQVTRAAICGNATGDLDQLLKSPHRLVNVNLNSGQFCSVTEEIKLFNCQPEETIIAVMNEQCALGPTMTAPNVTTLSQSNSTVSANETTTVTTNSSSTSANETTTASANTNSTSANGTSTATTDTSSTSANETSTITNTTAGGGLASAYALLEMSKNAAQLNSSQVDQLVSTLENILSGPTVGMELGNISVEIVSNLQSASEEAVDNSKNRIMGIVDTVGLKLVLTDTTESILSDAVALSVQQADGKNFQEAHFSILDADNVENGNPRARRAVREISSVPQGSITLPSSLTQNLTAEQQQMVSRVQFNFYQKSTLFQDKSMGDRVLNSGILGASVANVTISNLQDNVIIYLRNLQPVPANYVATCVFWDFTMNDRSGGWNSNGCFVQNTTDNETICACNHLTSFGILLDLSREPILSRTQANILTFITYIGCGISAIFLAITLLTYLAFGKLRKDIPSKILIQLCFSLLFLNLVFLVDAWLALYPDAVGLCISTAWFLHYFLLVAFSWMGLEAVHMYIALVKVFNSHISHYMLRFSVVGWGVPMIVVIIVIAIDKDNYGLVSYGKFTDGTSDEFCWIRNDVAFYVAVVAYFCVIFLFNLVMFIVVLVQLRRLKRQNPHNLQHRTTLQDVRSVLGITILLGLTWGFAFFAWGPLNLPFMYLFAIFNSLQGFFIFIFHCAVKENVRRQWRTYLCCGRMRLAENSEWSRTATQKTMKKSSVTRITSLHSSKSNNSSNSSSYLVSDSSDQMNGFGSPFSDGMITADEDPRMDVILNEINSQYRRL